jgi:hypothetical protein
VASFYGVGFLSPSLESDGPRLTRRLPRGSVFCSAPAVGGPAAIWPPFQVDGSFTAHADFLEVVELSIIRAAGPRRLACEDQPVIRLVIVLLLTCFVTFSAGAQEPVEPPVQQPVASADTAVISARGALVRSLVLPGWGQTYVGAPGRGAIYFAAEAGSLWMVYKARQQLRAARVLERHLLDTGVLPADQRLDLVLSRQAQQEDWITLAIFLLFFSGADAYVAAQLADFDERFGVRQSASGGVQLEARVPVGVRR